MIKNRVRPALALPAGVAGSKARPAPHPIEETTNGPLPGLGTPRASHQDDQGPFAQSCDPRASDLAQPSRISDESDRKARVGASTHPKEITNPRSYQRLRLEMRERDGRGF